MAGQVESNDNSLLNRTRHGEVRCAQVLDGTMPALDFYNSMSESDQASFQSLFLSILNTPLLWINNRERFKSEDGPLCAFKRSGKKKIRLFAFRDCNTWWLVCGIQKKEDDLAAGDLKRANDLMIEARQVIAKNKRSNR